MVQMEGVHGGVGAHDCTAEGIIKTSNQVNHLHPATCSRASIGIVNADMSISTQLLHGGRNHSNKQLIFPSSR